MQSERCVNVVGAGLAGLSAAVTLAERGVRCNLISSQPSDRAQSVLAEGGINAALDTMGENDSPAEHLADTLRGGCYLETESAVKNLTDHAPGIVERFVLLGAPLAKRDGKLLLRNFGGQKKKRTAYAGTGTGRVLMAALIDEARKYEAAGLIRRFSHHTLTGLTTENGALCAAEVLDSYTGEALRFTGKTILCTGGPGGFFPGMTTGSAANTGDAAAAAFAAGAEFANLEMIQYHPTTVSVPGKRMLVSEAARGEGGRLFIQKDGKPFYFMEEAYPEYGNLAPRDVISREIFLRMRQSPGAAVFLDMTALGEEVWREKLGGLRNELISYLGTDPKTEPVAVAPGIHYFMGGLRVTDSHETSVRGLFAAGEAACRYHGANRLGGNSMLGAIWGGSVAAQSAAAAAEPAQVEPLGVFPSEEAAPRLRQELKNVLLSGLGIVRDGAWLSAALGALDAIAAQAANETDRRRLAFGRAMLESALIREESRGAHCRADFPETEEAFRRQTVAAFTEGEVRVTLGPKLKGALQYDV